MSTVESRSHQPRHEWFWVELELALMASPWADHPFVTAEIPYPVKAPLAAMLAAAHLPLMAGTALLTERTSQQADGLLEVVLTRLGADLRRQVAQWRSCTPCLAPPAPAPSRTASEGRYLARFDGTYADNAGAAVVTLYCRARTEQAITAPVTDAWRVSGRGVALLSSPFDDGAARLLEAALSGLLTTYDPFRLIATFKAALAATHDHLDALETMRVRASPAPRALSIKEKTPCPTP